MKLATEQLLGTLEVLVWHPHPSRIFVWETEEQGEFNVWNLAIAQGFVSLSDVDVAIAHWHSFSRQSWALALSIASAFGILLTLTK